MSLAENLPMPIQQQTISQPIELQGIGLHSGQMVTLQFLPAEVDTGVVFLRQDLADAEPIPAYFTNVTDTVMSSNLTNALGQRIGTVEHLLSAVSALGIDNLIIQVSASEIPIMDGSASVFIKTLQQAGITTQGVAKKFIKILRPVEVRHEDKIARFTPYEGFSLDFEIAFEHPAFQPPYDKYHVDLTPANFIEQIAQARTFGFLKDIDYLKSQNLALGGSMDNAIVLDDTQVLNPTGLRFADEFVRHKILDAVGDLYLAGHQILGAFYGYKSGHALNNQLLRAVFASPDNYKVVTNYENVIQK
ncbi:MULTISPECIES: UDP-3-O-acyl-N-acetylglucosamine deacetylase [unclassified Moraxella]|uniref:UDP-3-O-acyl-N-acetylglucosamine deacetylase n=1 Tax=unclassified Moraxella TaxID=2685852 RepID=UPI003AF4118A